MQFNVGNFVVHKQLAELGRGEIIKSELGALSIRFACGVRDFSESIVGANLEQTTEAPVWPPPAASRKAAANEHTVV